MSRDSKLLSKNYNIAIYKNILDIQEIAKHNPMTKFQVIHQANLQTKAQKLCYKPPSHQEAYRDLLAYPVAMYL